MLRNSPPSIRVDRRQTALTARFLAPVLPALEALFLEIRAETDRAFGSPPARYGKPYPYGFCLEISLDVLERLRGRMKRPRSRGERALRAFLDHGGTGRRVWGALRDRYFQNAFQFGGLYIDVSNDTVDINKPKVEILPMAESGLALVEDVAHFARIAESYWDVRVYANHALPALAPAFPMILVDRDGRAGLNSNTKSMLDLACGHGFLQAEAWLERGPAPAPAVVEAVRSVCPQDMLADNPVAGRVAALDACRRLRADGLDADEAWRARMRAQFIRLPRTASIPVPERG